MATIILEKGAAYCWPALLIAFIIIFYKQIGVFLSRLASVADRANIEFMGVKWSTTELNRAVTQREVLKTVILIAGADGTFDDRETQHLRDLARTMVPELENLSQEAKTEVLQEAINMAAIDEEIQQEELEALRLHADKFGVDRSKLDDLIVEKCILDGTKPPKVLSEKYKQTKDRLGQ